MMTGKQSSAWRRFAKLILRGCQRHLIAVVLLSVFAYSIFFVSQYVVLDSSRKSRQYNLMTSLQQLNIFTKPPKEVGTWGNIAGLNLEIGPIFNNYTKSKLSLIGSDRFDNPWRRMSSNLQDQVCETVDTSNIDLKASIIITLHGCRIDKALTSLFQLLENTNVSLVRDVILIGDIGLPGIYRDIYELFPDYLSTFRFFVTPKRQTLTAARKYAAKFVHGDVLVFLDGHVLVTRHWLEHILQNVVYNPNLIIQPLVINYTNANGRLMYTTKKLRLDLTQADHTVVAPRGNAALNTRPELLLIYSAFALSKTFYSNLREFEDNAGFLDLDNIVFSFKSWMCGGGIVRVPCSVVKLQKPGVLVNNATLLPRRNTTSSIRTRMIKRHKQLLFVVSAWLSPIEEVFKCFLPKISNRLTYMDKRVIKLNKIFYFQLRCKPMSQMMSKVQPNFIKPPRHTTRFGDVFLNGTGIYLSPSLEFVSRPLIDSAPFSYGNYSLQVDHKCVTMSKDNHLSLEMCSPGNPSQNWVYTDGYLQLKINPALCIVKEQQSTIPRISHCQRSDVLNRFNFTFSFQEQCIK